MAQAAVISENPKFDPLRSYVEDICKDVLQEILGKQQSTKKAPTPIDENSPPTIQYATRHQMAKELHVSLPTLDNKVKTGEIPGLRFGSRVLFDRTAVHAALKQIKSDKFYNSKATV